MSNRLTVLEQGLITKSLKKTLSQFGLEIIRIEYPLGTRVLPTTIHIQTLPNLSFIGKSKAKKVKK